VGNVEVDALKRSGKIISEGNSVAVHIKRITTPPTVLSIDEVRLILKTARTPQSRAFLSTVYSCGLRLSEAQGLTIHDIDGERMTLRGKGKGKGSARTLRHYLL
jgi:integrase